MLVASSEHHDSIMIEDNDVSSHTNHHILKDKCFQFLEVNQMRVALVTSPFICNALSILVINAKAPEAVDPSSSPRSPEVLNRDNP